MIAWLTAHERWLPALAAMAWWATFYPGFFGDDSLINLGEARSGDISVWFTVWWVYVIDIFSIGTRAIPLFTLLSVLAIEYAIYLWAVTVFPPGRARTLTVLTVALTPLVGAMGIQVRHDIAMNAGLLLSAVVLTRTWSHQRFAAGDLAMLALSAPLVATRHNGMPTILVTAIVCAILRRWRQAGALAAVAAAAAVITFGATRAAGQPASVHPMQTVEWLMSDISCALSRGVEPTAAEWATLARIADPGDWPQERACYVMNPLHNAPTFRIAAIEPNYRDLVRTWLSLTRRQPLPMIDAHATRVRLFLPPFVTGVPDTFIESFLHSTILPNDFGLRWAWPSIAERARIVVRAWNAAGFVLANSALWLMVLLLAAWKRDDLRRTLIPTIIVAIVLNLGLLAAAPISEGRYALFILICGQATALYWAFERWQNRRA